MLKVRKAEKAEFDYLPYALISDVFERADKEMYDNKQKLKEEEKEILINCSVRA